MVDLGANPLEGQNKGDQTLTLPPCSPKTSVRLHSQIWVFWEAVPVESDIKFPESNLIKVAQNRFRCASDMVCVIGYTLFLFLVPN